MRTAVVILNWNTRTLLERFLPAVVESCRGIADVVVADNASTDGSADMVEKEFPETRLIRLEENLGFTGGYNAALAGISDAEYYVLLNSDIDLDKGWLEPLVKWMDSHQDCAVCGPKLLALGESMERTGRFEYAGAAGGMLDRFGYPWCRGRVMKMTEEDRGQYDTPEKVFWVSGACLMTRKSVWESLGGLDGRFFAHMEEIDYCWRAALRGWSVNVVPESRVWHLGGGTLKPDSPLKLKLNFRNSLLMLDSNLADTIGPLRASLRIFTRKLLDGAAALAYLLSGRKYGFKAVLEAHREYRQLKDKGKSIRSRAHRKVDTSLRCELPGFGRECILVLAFIKKEKIFRYLYENHH